MRQGILQIFRAQKSSERSGLSTVWQQNCPIIGHVLILALDTSSPFGSLAFLRDDNVLGLVATSSTEIYSSRVFRHLDFLLGELSLRLEDFDLFAVAAGPGSFTGLRVGLAAVKGWAEVFGKPIAAVSALESVAAQSRSRAPTLVPVMDARRDELYWAFYRQQSAEGAVRLALQSPESVGPRDEFVRAVASSQGTEELTIVTPDPEAISGVLSHLESLNAGTRRISVDRASPILAPEIGRLGWLRAREGALADSLTLDANYIRRSDAELHWKGPTGS
jgi:tRNA threonylcarbamoyladenosine biosynthesis protein TsaB